MKGGEALTVTLSLTLALTLTSSSAFFQARSRPGQGSASPSVVVTCVREFRVHMSQKTRQTNRAESHLR